MTDAEQAMLAARRQLMAAQTEVEVTAGWQAMMTAARAANVERGR